jgi:hypothetical protein
MININFEMLFYLTFESKYKLIIFNPMKILKLKFLVLFVASMSLFTGCDNDSEEVVSPFVGNFVISQAETAATITIKTVEMGTIDLPAGFDITQAIQTALLSSVNCSTADKSWVELRKDNSMYMSCEGTNQLNAGTWEEIDTATLKLNMNSAAIPSSPTGFVLTVTNIVTSATGLRGKTSVPLPKEMVAVLVAPFTLDASTPPVMVVEFYLDFIKK